MTDTGSIASAAAAELPRENVFGHTKKARLLQQALGRLRARNGRDITVLDVGCGNGTAITRFLAAPGSRVLGIDSHAASVEYARRHIVEPGVEFRAARLESLLEAEQRFDAVVFADVLEHVHQPDEMLADGVRLLREGGRVLVTVPNGYGPFEIESWVSRLPLLGRASVWTVDHFVAVLDRFVFKDAWTEVVAPPDLPYNSECGHVRFFTERGLLDIARRVGLTPVRKQGLSWLSGPYTNYLFAPSRRFCAANARLADWLPFWMLSGWYFELARASETASAGVSQL